MIPVQVLARILDVPPKPDSADRPLSGLVGIQPVQNVTQRDQAASRTAFEHFSVGQTLTGTVKSQEKGISMVEVGGQTVAMRLPHPAAAGDTLTLRFAGHMPHAVFMLELPEAASSEAPRLSQTARMLSEIMQQVPERNAPPTLTPPGPLLARPAQQVAELALALRNTVVRSGLFYESHLANWAMGQDSLDGLMQEPQNRLAAKDAARADAQSIGTQLLQNAGDTAAQKTLNPMHALLSQQLQVLESPQFLWRGELWPGQELEWQLQQKTDPDPQHAPAGSDDAHASGWDSHLKLTLPQLGTLSVHIRLDPQGAFSIQMVPQQAEIEPLLQSNQELLKDKMTAAGCSLRTLTVEHDHGAT